MLFGFLDAHRGNVMTPRAEDARHETLLNQMRDALVGSVEVFRADRGVIRRPRKTSLMRAARVEWKHVRIKAGDDLDDVETFLLSVSSECFEFVRPMQPVTKPHPPRVAEPEERRAIRMFQGPVTRCNTQRAVDEERICSCIGLHENLAANAVNSFVPCLRTLAVKTMRSDFRRGVPCLPHIRSRPERRHAQLAPFRVSE